MKLRLTVVNMGGGFRKIIFGQTRDAFGEWNADAVIGSTDEELLERLRARLPGFRNQLRRVFSCQ